MNFLFHDTFYNLTYVGLPKSLQRRRSQSNLQPPPHIKPKRAAKTEQAANSPLSHLLLPAESQSKEITQEPVRKVQDMEDYETLANRRLHETVPRRMK